MITLYDENNVEIPFKITKFPDGTSQVWQLTTIPPKEQQLKVVWRFENETEVFHLIQLLNYLIDDYTPTALVCPWMPYGRQDKNVDNNQTFALTCLLDSLNVTKFVTFDNHGNNSRIHSISAIPIIKELLKNYDVACYPDAGAKTRYYDGPSFPTVYCEKVRNQLTGQIEGLKLHGKHTIEGKKILIVDDLCDGGMTFIKVAEKLKEFKPSQIDLYVSHGLFTKGLRPLFDAGITNIYTTNSVCKMESTELNANSIRIIDINPLFTNI